MTRETLLGVAMAAVALSAGPVAAGPPAGTGTPRVRGEVVWIDEARGSLTLKTGQGSAVALHLPPGVLKGVRKGDRLTLELAVDRTGSPGAKAAKETPPAKAQ
jgi:hypothetical protein